MRHSRPPAQMQSLTRILSWSQAPHIQGGLAGIPAQKARDGPFARCPLPLTACTSMATFPWFSARRRQQDIAQQGVDRAHHFLRFDAPFFLVHLFLFFFSAPWRLCGIP